MVRKVMGLAVVAVLGVVTIGQWKDIQRYVRIRQMSQGGGHPEYVPAGGRAAYPHPPAGVAAGGEGESGSSPRGGPAGA